MKAEQMDRRVREIREHFEVRGYRALSENEIELLLQITEAIEADGGRGERVMVPRAAVESVIRMAEAFGVDGPGLTELRASLRETEERTP